MAKSFTAKSLFTQLSGLAVLALALVASTLLVKQKTNFENRALSNCSSIIIRGNADLITCNNTLGCAARTNQCVGTSLSQCNHVGCSAPPTTHYCQPEYNDENSCRSAAAASHGCRPQYSAQSCYGISSSDDGFCSSFAGSSKVCNGQATGGRCTWRGRYTGCNGQWTTEQCRGTYYSCDSIPVVCSPNEVRCSSTSGSSSAYQQCSSNGSAWVDRNCDLNKKCYNRDAYHPSTGCY